MMNFSFVEWICTFEINHLTNLKHEINHGNPDKKTHIWSAIIFEKVNGEWKIVMAFSSGVKKIMWWDYFTQQLYSNGKIVWIDRNSKQIAEYANYCR